MKELTEKQNRFCEEYIIDLNGTQAAIRAGYSAKSARVDASRMLTNANIQKRITELRSEISKANGNLVQRVIDELTKIGFSNVQDYLEPGNAVKDLSQIEAHKTGAISSIKKSIIEFGDKENGGVKTVWGFTLWDKISALEKLGRHLGIFEKDHAQGRPETIRPFSDAQVDRIISSLRNR